MPIIRAVPRELLVAEYTATPTFTSTAATGQALSPTWGGTFIIGNITTVDIEVVFPDYYHGTANNIVAAYLLLDGTAAGNMIAYRRIRSTANSIGDSAYIKTRSAGLSVGSHTISLQFGVVTGTGALEGRTDNKGILIVREVG